MTTGGRGGRDRKRGLTLFAEGHLDWVGDGCAMMTAVGRGRDYLGRGCGRTEQCGDGENGHRQGCFYAYGP